MEICLSDEWLMLTINVFIFHNYHRLYKLYTSNVTLPHAVLEEV